MTDTLTIAMPKGRIYEEAIKILAAAGIETKLMSDESRKLILKAKEQNINFIMAKPMDVPTYVEYGVADLGIAGKDVLLEEGRDVYEVLDLGISPCRLAVAGLSGCGDYPVKRVATKYPHTASAYFRQQGEQVEIIKLNGSVELAPIIGLADRIVDIVSTGKTLKENGLVETETIGELSSRLIINPANYRLKKATIDSLVTNIEAAVKGDDTWTS